MKNDFLKMVQDQMSDPNFIHGLSRQIGGADENKTAAAAQGIASVLTGALANNAADKQGASALAGALDRDHDGSILDDVFGMLSGGQSGSSSMLNGAGILSHVLGGRQSGATNMISKLSGLESNQVSQLMTMLAPVILGMLGKAKRQNHLDESGLAGMLNGAFAQQKAQNQNPAMDMISGFVDQDNDGDIADDIARLGKGLLGNFFGGR